MTNIMNPEHYKTTYNHEDCNLLFWDCSKRDDKTAEEVELKWQEELGEFARELLILSQEKEGRKSSRYRMPPSVSRLVEEAIDALICSLHLHNTRTPYDKTVFSWVDSVQYGEVTDLMAARIVYLSLKNVTSREEIHKAQYFIQTIAGKTCFWHTLYAKLAKWNLSLTAGEL